MGEITDMILEGILCEQCGVLIDGTATDYPRTVKIAEDMSHVKRQTNFLCRNDCKRDQ